MVDELVRGGLTHAVMSPGSRSTALVVALDDHPDVRLHVCIDERSAAFLAVGIGRADHRPAVVVTTSGTAVANLLPAVVEADHGRVPLIVLTADRPPELQFTGANQTVLQRGIFGTSVRWETEFDVASGAAGEVEEWRSRVAAAMAAAQGIAAAPGPVHLNVPFREPTVAASDDGRSRAEPYEGSLDGRPDGRPWHVPAPDTGLPAPDIVANLAGRIRSTERGLIVVGDPGCGDQGGDLGEAVRRLATAAGWPMIAEPHSGVRSGDHLVAHASVLLGSVFAEQHRPDLVVQIGRTTVSATLPRVLGDLVPQVLVDRDGNWVDPTRVHAEVVIVDPVRLLDAVSDVLAASPTPEPSAWLESWLAADGRAARAIDRILDGRTTCTEPQVARVAASMVPADGRFVVASSSPIRDVDAYVAAREDLTVVANRGASGIDGFVATSLGVALASGRPTVAIMGDLSFLHDRNALLAQADGSTPDVTLVVIDNNGGGIFHQLPQATLVPAFERLFGTPHGLDLADVARSHRLPCHVVAAVADLPRAISTSVRAGGLRMVLVRTSRPAEAQLRARLRDAVADAVS